MSQRRTIKDLQRKPARLTPYYCKGCGMLMSENKDLCSGCEEARQFGQVLQTMAKRRKKK